MRQPTADGGWFENRLGMTSFVRRFLRGTVQRHGALLRTTGMACLVLVLVECFTGAVLSVYYTPAPGQAYQDILLLEQNPFGRFLRGIHHWASATLLVLCGLTLLRMFFGAEYKGRRDLVWLAVLVFSHLMLFFQLTGHILPWDTNAAATANVEAGIGGNVWFVGPAVKALLLGQSSAGGQTLARWYGVHTTLLPLALLALIALPLMAYRLRQGETEEREGAEGLRDVPPDEFGPETREADPYYPVHMAREMVVALVIFLIVASLAWFGKTPLEAEATAANLQNYRAMSEWYVLPMHALTLIPPFNRVELEPLVTFVAPGLFLFVLFALPFIDRNPARRLRRRPAAVALGVASLALILGVSGWAVIKERPLVSGGEVAAASNPPAPPSLTPLAGDAKLVARGQKVYAAQSCDGCHAIAGKGGNSGPDLTHAGALHADPAWQEAHLMNPASKAPGSTMPAYNTLSKQDMKALVAYVLSLR